MSDNNSNNPNYIPSGNTHQSVIEGLLDDISKTDVGDVGEEDESTSEENEKKSQDSSEEISELI